MSSEGVTGVFREMTGDDIPSAGGHAPIGRTALAKSNPTSFVGPPIGSALKRLPAPPAAEAGNEQAGTLSPTRLSQDLHGYRCSARTDHIYRLGRAFGEVDNSAAHVRTSIVDPDDNRLPIGLIGHFDPSAEREGFVRCGHAVHVVPLAVGSRTAVEAGTIPRGYARKGRFRRVGLREGRCYSQHKGQGGAGSDPQKILHC